ncbi:hypothetical protein ACSE3M_07505 [Bacillus velezensis]
MRKSFKHLNVTLLLSFKAAYPSNTHTLIPIPLSGERLAERGFNQSELLASLLGMPVIFPSSD